MQSYHLQLALTQMRPSEALGENDVLKVKVCVRILLAHPRQTSQKRYPPCHPFSLKSPNQYISQHFASIPNVVAEFLFVQGGRKAGLTRLGA
jgi:hypothetical protein